MAQQAIAEAGQVMASVEARDGSAVRCGVGQAPGSSAGVTAGRRRGLFHEADFVRRQAVEAIDPRVDFLLQS